MITTPGMPMLSNSRATIPRATYATLDRAGHGVYLEQDALFRALTSEWLDRVEESVNAKVAQPI